MARWLGDPDGPAGIMRWAQEAARILGGREGQVPSGGQLQWTEGAQGAVEEA